MDRLTIIECSIGTFAASGRPFSFSTKLTARESGNTVTARDATTASSATIVKDHEMWPSASENTKTTPTQMQTSCSMIWQIKSN